MTLFGFREFLQLVFSSLHSCLHPCRMECFDLGRNLSNSSLVLGLLCVDLSEVALNLILQMCSI